MSTSQDILNRGNRSFVAPNRTIAAAKFAERVREKAGDCPVGSDHNEILGNMVDLHHRNMSLVRENILRYKPTTKSYPDSTMFVDEFVDDDSDGEEDPDDGPEGGLQTGSNFLSSILDTDAQTPPKPSNPLLAKKPTQQELDPAAFLRQVRATTMSRTSALPSSLKGAYAFLPPPPEPDDEDDDLGLKADPTALRGKSFLCRSDQPGGAADDMLAQIRGPKWNSDSITNKASKPPLGRLLLSTSRSDMRGEVGLSASLGSSSVGHQLPVARSFTTSAPGTKRSGALPGVSVDVPPSSVASGDSDRGLSSRQSQHQQQATTSSPSRGLFSKLKRMMES